ncbi:MAG: hypothetical protein LBQ59_05850 [Candidatus Peribacteria bacterium]|jgi:hypothetical protein|nr:hypothetical protein [Candidatus Peribacteria bacterium]
MADKVSKYLQYLIKTGETNFKENLKKKVKFSSLIELPLMINMALEHQEELKDVNGDDKNTRKIFLKNTNKLDEIQKVIEDILSPNKTIIENLQENLMP